ncbi:MAG: hypothetical protein U0350_08955 [Caldilineaceae bacterium]
METYKFDIDGNVAEFLAGNEKNQGLLPTERYASFDYCFNYFQSFREKKELELLTQPEQMQMSCLHLAFYLASWGMLRGSSFLLQKSIKFYEPLVKVIALSDPEIWSIDVDQYSEENIKVLFNYQERICKALGKNSDVSDILITKIMLGVFGNVPAFDTQFTTGFPVKTFCRKALIWVGNFYKFNRATIDKHHIHTIDFETGQKTHRVYPKAKIVDMIGFIEGSKQKKS